jgi:hypothetical protein
MRDSRAQNDNNCIILQHFWESMADSYSYCNYPDTSGLSCWLSYSPAVIQKNPPPQPLMTTAEQ